VDAVKAEGNKILAWKRHHHVLGADYCFGIIAGEYLAEGNTQNRQKVRHSDVKLFGN